MQGGGSLQNAHYALVKALASGTAAIEGVLGEIDTGTNDTTSFGGHLYSNKAPGFAAAALPAYLVVRDVGVRTVGDPTRALWALGLVVCVLPAVALVVAVRHVADRFEPGFGTASAVVLGAATLVLPFTTLFLSHVLSALLVFAAFAVLVAERNGTPRPALVAAAGALAGLAVAVEYPNVVAVAILGLYVLARPQRVSRALVYASSALAGVAPLLLYSLWAYGSLTHTTYDANAEGDASSLFGAPSLDVLLQLFLSKQGLFVITPVLACAVVGTLQLAWRGLRAEALVIAAMTLGYAVVSSAFYAPFGGFSPGPRYLVTVLPFLAVAIGPALRQAPVTTAALGLVSAIVMTALTASHPLAGYDGRWLHRLGDGDVPLTAASLAGITGWYAVLPLFAAVALATWLALRSAPPVPIRPLDAVGAGVAVLAWAAVAAGSSDGGPGQPGPYGTVAALLAVAFVALLVRRGRGGAVAWVRGKMALR
jgi:hypothetical protein